MTTQRAVSIQAEQAALLTVQELMDGKGGAAISVRLRLRSRGGGSVNQRTGLGRNNATRLYGALQCAIGDAVFEICVVTESGRRCIISTLEEIDTICQDSRRAEPGGTWVGHNLSRQLSGFMFPDAESRDRAPEVRRIVYEFAPDMVECWQSA